MYNVIRRIVHSSARERFHSQRAQLFITLMKPRDGISILDVGGGWGDFLARVRDAGVEAKYVVADIGKQYSLVVQKLGFEFVQLEEGKPLPFNNRHFEIVISNSVIEHVTMPKESVMSKIPQQEWARKSLQSQIQFANEIRRIGKAYFVQTPHKSFPIEAHTWLPFVNYLSHNHTVSLVRFTDKWWAKYCGYADWNLLGHTEMNDLFPEARIHIERFLGLPKSVIAYYLGS
jgi:hypothetical protein